MATPKRVSPQLLRAKFNELRLAERADRGELLVVVERVGPAREGANQPPGTISRTVWYLETGAGLRMTKLALVHEYILPNGARGGSGKPDPKRLIVGDEIWFV